MDQAGHRTLALPQRSVSLGYDRSYWVERRRVRAHKEP